MNDQKIQGIKKKMIYLISMLRMTDRNTDFQTKLPQKHSMMCIIV